MAPSKNYPAILEIEYELLGGNIELTIKKTGFGISEIKIQI